MSEFNDLPELIPDQESGEGSAAPNPKVKATFSWGMILWTVLIHLFFWPGLIFSFLGLFSFSWLFWPGILSVMIAGVMVLLGLWWENRK